MRRSFRTRVSFSGWIPRVCTLGWYAMPRWGMGSGTWWRDWLQRSRSDTSGRDAPLGMGSGTWLGDWLQRSRSDTSGRDARWGMDAGSKCHCSICPTGQRIPAQSIALGTAICPEGGNAYQPRATPWEPRPRELVCSERTPHRKGGERVCDEVFSFLFSVSCSGLME